MNAAENDIARIGLGSLIGKLQRIAAEVGELLVIKNAGAYGFAMSSNYNSKPLAAEVLIRDRVPHLIRRRQTTDDLVRGELIPQDG